MNVGDAKAQWHVHSGDGGEGDAGDAGAKAQQLHCCLQPESCHQHNCQQLQCGKHVECADGCGG
jgi:hypothetical protein